MENRMRDLEQIQEKDGGDRGRRLGSLALAVVSVVGLTFAMGVVVGKAAMPEAEDAPDPLAQLQTVGKASAQPSADTPAKAPEVDPAELTFPRTLVEEDRPEVLAALKAAAREKARLEAQSGAAPEPATGQAAAATVRIPEPEPTEPVEEPAPRHETAPDTAHLASTLPAAVAAGPASRTLPQNAMHDPMVAAALPHDKPAVRAPKGMEGKYTLQVISYDSRRPAEDFAEGLRARGHEAYVISADIPDRGRFFRVRIGPFESRGKAETYRRKFEQEELMHTFVVRQRER